MSHTMIWRKHQHQSTTNAQIKLYRWHVNAFIDANGIICKWYRIKQHFGQNNARQRTKSSNSNNNNRRASKRDRVEKCWCILVWCLTLVWLGIASCQWNFIAVFGIRPTFLIKINSMWRMWRFCTTATPIAIFYQMCWMLARCFKCHQPDSRLTERKWKRMKHQPYKWTNERN